MKLKAKHFACIYLLKTGGIGKWKYYGGMFEYDKDATNVAYHDILEHGVNWTKTNAPTDSYDSSFAGTFADGSNDTNTMEGTIYTLNGHKYLFDCTFEADNIFEVMEEISGIESVEQFIAKELLKEL